VAKKKVEQPQREVTKRQRSRWQREERRRRFILYAALLCIVAVVAILGTGLYNGWYKTDFKPLHETVLEVNGTKYNMNYYINMLNYYRQVLNVDATQMNTQFAELVTKNIEIFTLMKQEAAKMGYTASDEDVKLFMTQSQLQLKKEYWDVARQAVISQYLMGDFFDKQVPSQADQKQVMALFVDSEAQANDIRARLAKGEDFAKLAEELSLDATTKEKKGDLGWVPQDVLTRMLGSEAVDNFVFSAGVGGISQPIADTTTSKKSGYWVIKVLEKSEAGDPHVHPILVGTPEEADAIIARIEGGEDFDQVQGEVSQDLNNRCLFDLKPGTMSTAFDAYVFDANTQVGVISDPIHDDTQTTMGGYWVVKVVGAETNKDISDDNRTLLKATALEKWEEALLEREDNQIVSKLDDEKMSWALSKLLYG